MKLSMHQGLAYLVPWVLAAVVGGLGWYGAEVAVPRLIRDAYAQQSLAVLNRIIKDRSRPVEFYLQEWHERRQGLFGAALAAAGFWAAGAANLILWLRTRQKHSGRLTLQQLDRAMLLLVLGVAGGMFFLLTYPLWTGHVYLYDDLGYLHLPLRTYYSQSLANGRIPTWCPDLFCGFDALGEGQGGFVHPVKLFLYGLLPLELAFNVDTVLAYPVAFGGMWFLLRRWRVRPGPAAMGGMTYALSAYLALRLNHTNVIQILAHLPWLLGCVDLMIRWPSAWGRCWAGVAVAGLTASQLLLGYPPSVWYSGVAELVYGIVVGWGPRLPGKLLAFGAAKLLGLLLAAVQVLPTLATIGLSQRANLSLQGLAMDSLIPWNLFQWVSPFAFTERCVGPARPWEFAQYAGLLAPAALVWLLLEGGLWRRWQTGRNAPALPDPIPSEIPSANEGGLREQVSNAQMGWAGASIVSRAVLRGQQRRLVVWAGLMILLGAVFALGAYGPVFWLLAPWPPFRFFRSWCRYSLWIFLGLSVAAALAVQAILQRVGRTTGSPTPLVGSQPGLSPAVHRVLAGLVVISAVPLILARVGGRLGWEVPWGSMAGLLVGPVGLAIVWWLLAQSVRGKPWALLALVGLHGADLAWYDLSYWLTRCRFDRLERFIGSIQLPPDQKAEGVSAGGTSARGRIHPPGQEPGQTSEGAFSGGTPKEEPIHRPAPGQKPGGASSAVCSESLRLGRVWTEPAQEANVFLLTGRRSAGGWWGGLVPRQTLPYPALKAFQVAGVTWWKKDPFEPTAWQRVPQPLPEIRLVSQAMVSQNPAQDLQKIDPAQIVLVDRPVDVPPPGPMPTSADAQPSRLGPEASPSTVETAPAAGGDLMVLAREPGFFRIQTDTPTRQVLVVAETWHPGWSAQVDGQPVEILRAYGDFMAVEVGPGVQEVRLAWTPASLRWGLLGTGTGMVLLGLWIGLGCWRGKHN